MEESESGASNLQHYNLTLSQRSSHINDTLVAAAAEAQLFVFKGLNETAVYEHINKLHEFPLRRVLQQLLKKTACITPYILAAALFNGTCKRCKALRLEHGVTARECDIGKGVGKNHLKDILDINIVPVVYVPRLGVMTPWTMVRTACTIYCRTETRTIDRSVFHNVEYG